MDIQVVTPADEEPVSVREAFVHLRIEADTQAEIQAHPDYSSVGRMITTARQWVEDYCRRSLAYQTLRLVLPPPRAGAYRASMFSNRAWPKIELYRPPLVAVEAVRYYDDSNVLTTLDEDDYFVVQGTVPTLGFATDYDFPSVYLRQDAIQVDYTAGFLDADDVPEVYRDAILLGVQLSYDSLTPGDRTALENARENLLSTLRVMRF